MFLLPLVCIFWVYTDWGGLSLQAGTHNFKMLPLLKPTPGGLGVCGVQISGGRAAGRPRKLPPPGSCQSQEWGSFAQKPNKQSPGLACAYVCARTHTTQLCLQATFLETVSLHQPHILSFSV